MGDCSTNAWRVPKLDEREPGVIYSHQLYSREVYENAKAIEIAGVRFYKPVTCTLTRTYHGSPCSDWLCSACGKIHNAPRANAFCPRCAAKVTEVIWE